MTTTINPRRIRWSAPVYVRIGYGIPEKAYSAQDAIYFLMFRWPERRGSAHAEALRLCKKRNDARDDVRIREAFIEACIEARVLDDGGPQSNPFSLRREQAYP